MSSGQKVAVPNAWHHTSKPPPCDLRDVMSEQLIEQIREEDLANERPAESSSDTEDVTTTGTGECVDDEMIARQLQRQFDKEYNERVQRVADQQNGNSKVAISLEKFKPQRLAGYVSSEESEQDEIDEPTDYVWPTPAFNARGICKTNDSFITKHDPQRAYRKNARQMVDNFSYDIETGDDQNQLQLSNRVYNHLKAFSISESNRASRLHEKKEHSTAEMAVDEKSRLILFKLVNSGKLDSIGGVISTGKEAVVLNSMGGQELWDGCHCAVKVFKTTLTEFRNRQEYIRGDYRFMKLDQKRCNSRKLVEIWAEKEMANLKKISNNGLPCPLPLVLRKHVVVMSLIGDNGSPAPILKTVDFGHDRQLVLDAYNQSVSILSALYQRCQLIHADFSEYNLLWHQRRCVLIDVSQAVDLTHPLAHQFLLRDCRNVFKFFSSRLGSSSLLPHRSAQEIFNHCVRRQFPLDQSDELFIQRVRMEEKPVLRNKNAQYSFDYTGHDVSPLIT